MIILGAGEIVANRQALENLCDTFGVPIKIITTEYSNGAFQQTPVTAEYEMLAIKEFISKEDKKDQFRNGLGPAEAHEQDLFIFWDQLVSANLVEAGTDRLLVDHNDLVEMEGQVYEIQAFSGVGYMTKVPSFVQMRIKRRWADVNGALNP
jgi:hypothetical protein